MKKPRLKGLLVTHLVTCALAMLVTVVELGVAPLAQATVLLAWVWGFVGLESLAGALLMRSAEQADLEAAQAVTVFHSDARFEQTLEGLRKHYGLSTQAEVIRKAVALLGVFRDVEDPEGGVMLRRDGHDVRVQVR